MTNTNGYMSARVGAMDVKSSGAVSNERGAVIGRSSLKLDAASLASNGDGQIGALDGNADVVMGAALTNAGGTLYARDTLMVRAEAIDNASGEAIGDSVDVTANRGLKNSMGRIMAAHKASLASETLDNQAGVIGAIDGPLIVATTGITDNERGKLLAGGDVALANAGLTNTDGVVSGADLDLKSGGQRIVNVGGVIEASGRLQSESGSLDNRRGQMRSVASVAPTPAEPDAAGRHSAAMIGDRTRDVTVTVGGNVDNTHGKILSAANLALKSQAFDNTSGNVQAGVARISTGQLNNLSGEMSTRSGQLDIESNGALSNAQGDLIGANGLKLDVASIASNEGGQIGSRGGEARITARAELNNIGGMMSAADTLFVRAGELDNTAGKALGDAIDAKADRLLANTDGRIVAARTANVETDKLVNHKGVIGAIDGPLTIATTGITDNGGGKLLAGGDVKLTNAGLANTDGVVSGASVGLKAGAGLIDNTRGVIDAAARIETDSAALDNRSGLIQSRGSAVFDMHGGTFDNRTAEGSEVGGRVIGKGVTLAAGGLRNTTGLISSSDETRVSAQLLTNDRGIILSREALALEMVGAVSNVSGQIGGDADVTLRGTRIDNTLGAVHAGQSLAVTGDKIVNAETKDSMVAPVSGLAALPAGMEGTTISLTATTDIGNSAGSVRSDQETNLKARTIGNTDGAITSSRRVLLSADATVTNSRGEINGGQMLRLSTGALNNDGRMESGGDVKIKTLDDFANLGVIVAGRDLDAHARGNVNNVGTMNARNVARISGRNIENDSGGEIMGDRGTHIHAEKSLFNRGLLDGGVTRVEAGDAATNVGRIYGDSASVGAQVVRNDADAQGVGGAIASRGNLDIGANVIENENGSLIYASNDIRTGRSLDADGRATDALSDRFTNNGALVDAGGHAKIAADRFENLNADFQTQKVTTDSGRQLWYTIPGSTERLDPSDVHFYQRNNHEAMAGGEYAWALNDDQKRLLLPSVQYPVSEYAKYTVNGTAGKIDNVRYPAIPRLYGDDYTVKQDADLVGVFRTVSDDMWAKFGVAPPPPPPDPSFVKAGNYAITLPLMGQRKLGADWYSLNVPMAQVQEQAGSPMTKLESCVTAATDGCRTFNEWYGKLDQSYTALSRAVNDYNSDVMSRAVDRWTIYDVSLKSTKDVVTATRPGRITTGGDLTIHAQSGINDKSQIVAGGRAHLTDAIQDNSQPKGVETFTALGQAITTWVESGGIRSGDQRKQDAQAYEAPLPAREIDLPIAAATTTNGDPVKRIAADAAAARGASGIRVTSAETKSIGGLLEKEHGVAALHDRALTTVEGSGGLSEIDAQFRALPDAAREQAAAHKPADLLVHNGAHVRAIAQVDLGNIEIRTVEPNVKLPNNALYQVVSDPGRRYLIETDPRFTNHKHWLSSETMVAALSTDPGAVQKRLGDGFYEQQLIQQQIVEATGQRFIGNYTDNQTQYQALMANGAKAAKRFDMNVGTALTDAQMAALTEDIVWLVNREISLPDGTLQKVLVPQVYLRANAADVTGTGAIIAGGSVAIDNGGSLANSGTIASRRATIITADSITNVGTVAGDEVRADAKEDLRSLGGLIQGNAVSLSAGRDVRLSSTTSSITTENGSAMAIDRAPTTNAGTLAIQAGRDLHTEAAQVVSTGDVFLAAERDLNMAAIRQSSDESVRWSEKRRAARSASVDTGTAIVSDGNIGLIAGRDFSATAGSVSAGGSLSVVAGGDVNLSAGEQSASAYDEHYMTESRLFSSKSSHTIDESSHTDAIGTMLSGDTVDVLAGRNATAKAATIAGTGDVKLKAGNDLTITTAETASSEHHFRDVKKSGLGSAGAGISYGSNRATDTSRDTLRGARGSLIGSIDGNVSLRAGEKLHATGSTIIASQDVTGIAKEVKIDAARTDRRHEETHEMYSSGFTLAVKSPVIDAIQNVNRQAHGAANSGDGRAEALHAIAAGGGMSDLVGAAGGMSDALSSGQNPEAKIELSFGASRSKTTITEEATESDGSVVKAGRRAAFVATGSESAGQGNVTIEGSAVTAEDVLIRAADRVNLLSSADTASTRSTNESTSASVGVSFGTNGWGVSAAMSRAHGDANSDAVMHNSSHINAGNTATIVSGGDANILGANINATKVMGDIGGDLKIASMQDTSRSAARQSSAGGGFSISQGGGSASISVKSGRASGSYAGVHEQSGIQAGNGGFDIAVKGNTDLKGAYIASTAEPEKNRLTTGTLSFSDIKNESSYRASSTGISAGGGVGDGGNNYAAHGPTTGKNAGGALPLAVSESGGSDALTRSAVSAGAITIADEANQSQDMSLLERDVTNLNGMVDKLPDLQDALSDQSDLVDASQAAAETVAREIGKYADKRERQAHDAARAETDPKLKAQYALEAQGWAEGGKSRVGLHIAGGALTGGLTGGGPGAVGGVAGAGLSATLAPKLDKLAQAISEAELTG
ncbi:MAG: hemagglutinin repeat-containing protein, partial [Trinickia sp.]